ncbi:MAG: hypothetical protein WBE74_08595, partial [Terracidiphilus sp.]
LAIVASSAPPKATTESALIRTSFAEVWGGLPQPIVHLRFASAGLVIELGYRSAGPRIEPARRTTTLRLIVSRSGKTDFTILCHNHRFAFPRRSA